MKAVAVDVVVLGAGPAGVLAALRAGDLGARTALVTRDEFGGMAAHDGPVPVRTLAHAARLIRDARQLGRYGIVAGASGLDYRRLLARVREVVDDVAAHAALRPQIDRAGVAVYEHTGAAHLVDAHTVETETHLRVRADKVILCTGGASRRLSVPGAERTLTHSDAWGLTEVPASMIVVGGGATGVQVASIFGAFGARVALFQAAARILPSEDPEVSQAVAESFRRTGIEVHEGFGAIEAFEETPAGVRMRFSKSDGQRGSAEASLVVLAVGWSANSAGLGLANAGVATDARGFVLVDGHLRTSVPHIFAAGDVTGRSMLVPQSMQDGFVAATNAVRGTELSTNDGVSPVGSYTEPEYASVGRTEPRAREEGDVVVVRVGFDSTTRTIIDGRTSGFCKLIVDRGTRTIVGCHVVGERAVDIVQAAALAMSAGTKVDALARVPLSFPTYTGVLGRAAATAARQMNLDIGSGSFAELL